MSPISLFHRTEEDKNEILGIKEARNVLFKKLQPTECPLRSLDIGKDSNRGQSWQRYYNLSLV